MARYLLPVTAFASLLFLAVTFIKGGVEGVINPPVPNLWMGPSGYEMIIFIGAICMFGAALFLHGIVHNLRGDLNSKPTKPPTLVALEGGKSHRKGGTG